MSEAQNAQIAEKFFHAMNQRDFSISTPYQAAEFRAYSPGMAQGMNAEQNRAYLGGFITAFPDLKFELQQTIAQGNYVVINWRSTGTHTGPLTTPSGNQIPATNKSAEVFGSTTYEFQDGKVVHTYNHWDMVSLLSQLGLMPDM